MQLSQEDKEMFFDLETRLHKKEVRNSVEAVSELIAEEFIEFGNSGTKYNKASIISELEGEQEDLNITVEDFEVTSLASEVALVTYKSVSFDNDSNRRVEAMRSSIWKLIDNRWQMVFHQGSRILS